MKLLIKMRWALRNFLINTMNTLAERKHRKTIPKPDSERLFSMIAATKKYWKEKGEQQNDKLGDSQNF
jgi:CRISPR/Cas system endoribonuclease Cas6 (RAMP superfamily)